MIMIYKYHIGSSGQHGLLDEEEEQEEEKEEREEKEEEEEKEEKEQEELVAAASAFDRQCSFHPQQCYWPASMLVQLVHT